MSIVTTSAVSGLSHDLRPLVALKQQPKRLAVAGIVVANEDP
jgi:hypothetical protein